MFPLRNTVSLFLILAGHIFGINQLYAATMAINNHSSWKYSESGDVSPPQSLHSKKIGATHTYTFSIIKPGWYDVYARWGENTTQHKDMSVAIFHGKGKEVFNTQPSANEGQWNHLGSWYFYAKAEVKIKSPSLRENANTNTIIKLTSTSTTIPARSIRGAKLNKKKDNERSGFVSINNKKGDPQKNIGSMTIYSSATKKSTDDIIVVKKGTQHNQAILSWAGPTTNSDGSVITNLAGYKVYMSTNPKSFSVNNLLIDIPISDAFGGMPEEFIAKNLKNGTYYFTVTAYNSFGIESTPSQEVSKTIN